MAATGVNWKSSDSTVKPADPVVGTVRYRSTGPEPIQFSVMDVRGLRDEGDNERVVWYVPEDIEPRFALHFFVVNGRIEKA